jgi:hypothetical protein
MGSLALSGNGAAAENIAFGYKAGDVISTGTRNVIIGYDVDPSGSGAVHELVIDTAIAGQMDALTDVDISGSNLTISGPSALAAATINQDGGDLVLTGGAPASGGGTAGDILIQSEGSTKITLSADGKYKFASGQRETSLFEEAGTSNYGWGFAQNGGLCVILNGAVTNTIEGDFACGSNKGYVWSATTDASAAKDTGLDRSAAAVVKFTDASTGLGSWTAKAGELDLTTDDAGFINFKATADADATSAISTLTTSGSTTHHIQVEINGTTAWIAASTTDPT